MPRTETVAVCPGTFDPITLGHLDVIQRAQPLFGRVIVGVAENPVKKPSFPLQERLALVKASLAGLPHVEVKPFKGLLVDFARKEHAQVIVRGLREISDFEEEFKMATANRKLAPDLETVFIMTSEKFFYLSSSLVREIAGLGGDVSGFVPQPVAQCLRQNRRRSQNRKK